MRKLLAVVRNGEQSNEICKFIRGGKQFRGRQGLDYFAGISAETVGSEGICMHLLTMPPGATAKAHYHQAHETAIYMLEGVIEVAHGPNLERVDRGQAGDFVYIPAGVPHRPRNPTGQVAKALIARTDPMEQESVVILIEGEGNMRPHTREDHHDLD